MMRRRVFISHSSTYYHNLLYCQHRRYVIRDGRLRRRGRLQDGARPAAVAHPFPATVCTAGWIGAGQCARQDCGARDIGDQSRRCRSRGIGDGEVVRVFNARGACFAGVSVTEAVRPGVVRLSCGAWYHPVGHEDEPACAHGNANVLTRDHGTSRLSQGPSSATALVEVAKCADPPPV
jgi:hypothetical protein